MKNQLPIKTTLKTIGEVFHLPFYEYKKISPELFSAVHASALQHRNGYFVLYKNRNILEKGDEFVIIYKDISENTKSNDYTRVVRYQSADGKIIYARLNNVNKLRWQLSEPLLKYFISLGTNFFGYQLTTDSIYKIYNKWKKAQNEFNKPTKLTLNLS